MNKRSRKEKASDIIDQLKFQQKKAFKIQDISDRLRRLAQLENRKYKMIDLLKRLEW